MKRYLMFILIILSSIALIGCGPSDSEKNEDDVPDIPLIETPMEVKIDGTKTLYASDLMGD